MLLDGTYGREALFAAAEHASGSAGRSRSRARGRSPSRLPDLGSQLAEWPVEHTIKCLCFYHPDDPRGAEGAPGARSSSRVHDAARRIGRELLIEIIASSMAR